MISLLTKEKKIHFGFYNIIIPGFSSYLSGYSIATQAHFLLWTLVHLHELQGLCRDLSFRRVVSSLISQIPFPDYNFISQIRSPCDWKEHEIVKRVENVSTTQPQLFTPHLFPLWPWTSYQSSLVLNFLSGKMRKIIVPTSRLNECNINN